MRLIMTALFLAGAAIATPVKKWTESLADCRSFTADVYAEATNIDFSNVNGGLPPTQEALVQWQVDQLAEGSSVAVQIASAPGINVTGSYPIYFEYCQPKDGQPKGVFQAIHGLVGNTAYWNVQIDGKTDNSFVESAAAAGWATLSYDRLGVGKSAHPDGLQVVQINYEIAQAISIAQSLRDGTLGAGIPHVEPVPAFSTIIGLGHSYGSALLTGVAGTGPETFDQIVFTGFTANVTFGPLGIPGFESTVASVAYPDRFNYGPDYVITPTVSVDQKGFFHYPNYTEEALEVFTTTKGEYTLGQFNSAHGLKLDWTKYSKPTLVVTGENDGPFCGANCYVTSLGNGSSQLDTVKGLLPGVADSDFATCVVPDTGHGLNFHTTAYEAYQQIINFVESYA